MVTPRVKLAHPTPRLLLCFKGVPTVVVSFLVRSPIILVGRVVKRLTVLVICAVR